MSSATTSPRGSELSFASVPSTFSSSSPPPKPNPPSPHSPHPPAPASTIPCPSTSTISRSSAVSLHSAADDLVSSPSHLLEPISTSRIPKARVFLERRSPTPLSFPPDRPRANSAHPRNFHSPARTRSRSPPLSRPHPANHREPRCVSDLHEAFRAQRGAAWIPVVQPPVLINNHPTPVSNASEIDLSDEALRFLAEDDDLVPSWVPADERLDWTPSVDIDSDSGKPDPCDEEENRWVGSLRNLSQLGTIAGRREKPAIRGSILEIRPPTVRERFGVHGRKRRGWDSRTDRVQAREERADEYVGFLLKGDPIREKKTRKARTWFRFWRRAF